MKDGKTEIVVVKESASAEQLAKIGEIVSVLGGGGGE